MSSVLNQGLRDEGGACWHLQWLGCLPVPSPPPSPLLSALAFCPRAPLRCHWKTKLVEAQPLVSTPLAPSFPWVWGAQVPLWTRGISGEGACLLAPSAFCLRWTPYPMGFEQQVTAWVKKLRRRNHCVPAADRTRMPAEPSKQGLSKR